MEAPNEQNWKALRVFLLSGDIYYYLVFYSYCKLKFQYTSHHLGNLSRTIIITFALWLVMRTIFLYCMAGTGLTGSRCGMCCHCHWLPEAWCFSSCQEFPLTQFGYGENSCIGCWWNCQSLQITGSSEEAKIKNACSLRAMLICVELCSSFGRRKRKTKDWILHSKAVTCRHFHFFQVYIQHYWNSQLLNC